MSIVPGVGIEDLQLDLAFAVQRNPGSYALLVGAGVSKEAGLPSAWDVQIELVRQAAAALGDRPDDPLEWWRTRTGAEPRYDALLEHLGRTPSERQAVLRRFFEPEPSATPPDRTAHRAIARLVAAGRVRVIVTLNFDHLLEDALAEAGVVPTVVSTPAEFAALAPLHAQRALVVHLHGDYVNPASMLNTAAELGGYDPRAEALVRRIAADHGLVLAGWSATWDDALRELVGTTPNPHYSSWWIDPFPLSAPAEGVRRLRDVRVLAAPAGEVLGRLADASEAIEATAARHPRSAEVAVASAKRALQGGVRAIALHDELRAEFARLAEHPAVTEREFTAFDVRAVLAQRTARFEEAVRVLLPLVATTAYWGAEESDAWWREEIPRMVVREERSGPTALTALQNYPAMVLLHAAGVATLANGRLAETHRLLAELTVQDPNGRYLGAGEVLAPEHVLLAPQAARCTAEVLRTSFVVHLGLGDRAYEDAWEMFHYLHLVERRFARVPDEAIEAVKPLARRAWAGMEWSPAYFSPVPRPEEAELQEAVDGLALDAVPVPHLRGHGRGGPRQPRISAGLRRDLVGQGAQHPLVRAGFCDGDVDALMVMISAVDRLVARAARDGGSASGPSAWLDDRAPTP